ncbi:excinuclease ABC subunit UvrC [Mycetocola reblochoni]|uniref:UvrABC system protein C n=2 Tax=Mycetocola reblochoni TaxID=331618 RepID=A0A1R4J4M6_9MICO|nr:excinuclease ABC subunit UvrC [Mycetocola reblochoni]RLP69542.1 excinuclease ABC subunit UvrC [Mycetocola reblochoni]SJN27040.1 Excinuclease ABC subunit C [Mycetocola reblochoni REB411]
MSTQLSYRPASGEIPTTPGVYRFTGPDGRVLYVGKAKNLRQRLSNYFGPLHTLHERTRRMVTTATGVTWTVVGSDVEALQLEYTWIKEFDPPFNVKFRDDKSYPYMVVTLRDEAPRVMVSRNRSIRGAKYFGPYPKIWAVNDTIELMVKAFPIRTCSDANYKRAMQSGRPCFAGQIGKCGGPCSGRVTIDEHRAIVDDFVAFMSGGDDRFVAEAREQMMAAAAEQDYERAALYRDRLQSLEAVLSKSAVVLSDRVDADLYAVAHHELSATVQGFTVRGGRIRGVRGWTVDKEIDMSTADIVRSALQRVYAEASGVDDIPKQILVPELPEDREELEAMLSQHRGRGRVSLAVPQRGEKQALMETASVNAMHALKLYTSRRNADFVARSDAMAELQDALGMSEAPLRMECYDISHLAGTNVVASMVVFEDGLPRKDQYRKFSIAETTDDTDSIHQVLTRRLARLRADDGDAGPDGAHEPAATASAAATPPSGATAPTATAASAGAAGAAPDDARPEDATPGPAGPGVTVSGGPLDGEDAAPPVDVADPDAVVVATTPRRRFAYPPQLLIVDGGQPQVQAAWRALEEAGRTDIAVCGIAKRLEELWLPNDDFPVILPRNSEALFLIQRIRDEAHRFAITYQRATRKRDITTVLSDVPRLGPARIKRLLGHFGSVTRLRAAGVDEIAQVDGIGPTLAGAVRERLSR